MGTRQGSRASGANPRALGVNPRALGTNPNAAPPKSWGARTDKEPGIGRAIHPVCPKCDRKMYATPCQFCLGKCGAKTKTGGACRWPKDECQAAKHSIYRDYTAHQLEDFYTQRASVPATPAYSEAHTGIRQTPRSGRLYGRKTLRELGL